MIKCEAIKNFTLERFNELKNLKRKTIGKDGEIHTGDVFECTKEMAEYLGGNNDEKANVIRIIEVLPEKKVEEKIEPEIEEVKPEKTKKTRVRKTKIKK